HPFSPAVERAGVGGCHHAGLLNGPRSGELRHINDRTPRSAVSHGASGRSVLFAGSGWRKYYVAFGDKSILKNSRNLFVKFLKNVDYKEKMWTRRWKVWRDTAAVKEDEKNYVNKKITAGRSRPPAPPAGSGAVSAGGESGCSCAGGPAGS